MRKINSFVVKTITSADVITYGLFALVITLTMRFTVHLFAFLFNYEDVKFNDALFGTNLSISIELLFNTLIFAPVVETLLFQTLFFYIQQKLKIHTIIIVLLSAISFSAIHDYSVLYIINAFIVGAFFMYSYVLRAENRNNPFWSIAVAHFFMNFFSVLLAILTMIIKSP